MPKGKGAKLSEAQLKALAAGRVAARRALAAANMKRKQEAEIARIKIENAAYKAGKIPKWNVKTINKAEAKEKAATKRKPFKVPLNEWLEAAKEVAVELGRKAIEAETDWGWMGNMLYQNKSLNMILNSVLPTATDNGNTGLYPKNAIVKVAKQFGVRVNTVGNVSPEKIEPPFNPVWEE